MKLRPRSPSPLKIRQARDLRREATLAERRVWDLLRNRRMLGLKFRRQYHVAGFVDASENALRLLLTDLTRRSPSPRSGEGIGGCGGAGRAEPRGRDPAGARGATGGARRPRRGARGTGASQGEPGGGGGGAGPPRAGRRDARRAG